MRVFLCDYSGFILAIPMSSVCALMLYENEARQTVEHNAENGNTYISLPRLFELGEENIRHGIILKNTEDEDQNIDKNRTIILTTEVKCETELKDDEIYPLPKIFAIWRLSAMFSGIRFDSRPLLLLDTGQLVQNLYKELTA